MKEKLCFSKCTN